jgi:phosphoglycerate dehydrogenase-like enzyme
MLFPEMLAAPIMITNSAGVHAVPIAEQSLAGILALLRGVDLARELQRLRLWSREAFLGNDSPVREVGGLRALILGSGGLGSALGARLSALGVHCTGVRRRPERGVPEGVERVVGPGDWHALLPESDILAICAPSTLETKQMVGAAELERLPRGAIIVNVARGALLDEVAMARRIQDGALRGAVLDVFSEEPLPESSPLWDLPSVIMTPHVAGVTDHFWEREMTLFLENWRAYDSGRPMKNVVDRKAGY